MSEFILDDTSPNKEKKECHTINDNTSILNIIKTTEHNNVYKSYISS